jgi:glycosyltransferase involved in cell wall biosynthesis
MTSIYQRPPEDNESAVELSIVIPVYNEREVLPICMLRLQQVLKPLQLNYELLFIDDGSDDGSAEWLLEQVVDQGSVRVVSLSRNFGKEAAMSAGLDLALGKAVLIFDADLQDPPELIPDMLEQWRKGIDVVLMQRHSRDSDSGLKRFTANLFYRILQRLAAFDIPLDVGDFRLMSRRAVEALKQLPERNRFMKGMFAWIGMPTIILRYDRAARAAGETKWNYFELVQFAFEGITSFSTKPLQLAIHLGMFTALCGGSYGAWIVFKELAYGDPVQGFPSLIAIITFLGGVQLLTIGIIGEYVGKTYIESKQRPVYLIREITDLDTASSKTQNEQEKSHG